MGKDFTAIIKSPYVSIANFIFRILIELDVNNFKEGNNNHAN